MSRFGDQYAGIGLVMGYNVEHAIIVTSLDKDGKLQEAHAKAKTIFPHVSEIVPHLINGGGSFLVPPDGSKEGWSESDDGNVRRFEFVRWLGEQRYEDGSTSLRWIEVLYADDEHRAEIVSGDHMRLEPQNGGQS